MTAVLIYSLYPSIFTSNGMNQVTSPFFVSSVLKTLDNLFIGSVLIFSSFTSCLLIPVWVQLEFTNACSHNFFPVFVLMLVCIFSSLALCQAWFILEWKSVEWTQRWVNLWNDLGFSLCAMPSICHIVVTLDKGERVRVEISTDWCVAVETPEIEFNESLSLLIIRLVNYNITTSLIYKLIV